MHKFDSLLISVRILVCIPALSSVTYAQVILKAGESYAYEFQLDGHYRSDWPGDEQGFTCILWAPIGSRIRLEMFEDSAAQVPFSSMESSAYPDAFVQLGGNFHWHDLQGAARLTALVGTVEILQARVSTHLGYDTHLQITNFPPILKVSLDADGQLSMSWRSCCVSYVLEANQSLSDASWGPVTNSISYSNDTYSLKISPDDRQKFYRLRNR